MAAPSLPPGGPLAYVVIVKIGMRTPSLRKSFKARTTGRLKRQLKREIIPGYGRRGMGLVKDPSRALKGAVYRRTTFSFWDLFKG